ncbi:NAD(P)H-dependent glycerol-3-phosphate dehydrogenase [Aliifodinibius sp. S!AR15-10]|uniref:NAD(P)H-dependent glycerol-3-phosphate dehydrogenase n=1 Tax=Aliifodinibius sp. S!AR15-10 TaxID=2950437 RepID=UPI002867710A|nr:NAD(P)H-dependent glycerol-3-phosphate dehydrogenase [Aliifodinibius sp. S!AR15-10]MDR8394372.1 NAD(P)H-dependent glycerol-3-phosphate dehydrogenase [Aliifodinibius sp. S!AR15-10]
MKKVSVIGAGSFGTALSVVLARAGNEVQLWARESEIASAINNRHRNPTYVPDVTLPDSIRCYTDLEECLHNRDMIVFATPSHAMREVAKRVKPNLSGDEIVVSVAKGIENDTFMTMSQVLDQVLKGVIIQDHIGVISGPSHAEEVSKFRPTTVVSASYSKRTAGIIQETFMTPMFRVYLNYDIVGVEVGGSVKNIMAIAAGIIDGAELGDNAKAALITRGLHEIKRLGMKLGASQDTFSGLTGVGDLIVTCTSEHSRNRYVGYHIGQGQKLEEIVESMSMIAEGVRTTRSVHDWSRKLNIEMPITDAVYQVLFEDEDPKDVLYELMTRDPKEEIVI